MHWNSQPKASGKSERKMISTVCSRYPWMDIFSIPRLSLNKASSVIGWFLVTCPWSNTNVSRPNPDLVSFAGARAGVTQRSPSPRGCFKPTYIPFPLFCAFVCLDQWASRLVVIAWGRGALRDSGRPERLRRRLIPTGIQFRSCSPLSCLFICLFVLLWLLKGKSKYITKHLFYGPSVK